MRAPQLIPATTETHIRSVIKHGTMSSPSASPRTDQGSPSVQSVVRRYRRVERAVSLLTALSVAGAVLAAFAAFSLFPALGVAVVLLVALRAPMFRRHGTVRLRSEADPVAVVDEFASLTPPVLAFQWAVADEVVTDGDGNSDDDGAETGAVSDSNATYELSYLFGLRSVSLDLAVDLTRPDETSGDARSGDVNPGDVNPGDARSGDVKPGDKTVPEDAVAVVDLDATVGGRPWGAYGVTVREAESGTLVDVELRPTRRFGLRRLPQGLVADRYYAEVLAAQGYEILDRSVSFSR